MGYYNSVLCASGSTLIVLETQCQIFWNFTDQSKSRTRKKGGGQASGETKSYFQYLHLAL